MCGMESTSTTLLVSDKSDPERDQVCSVWERNYGPVYKLGRFWDPPTLAPNSVRIYGAETFVLVLAQILDIVLVTPRDDLLLDVPEKYLARAVSSVKLSDAVDCIYPCFMKSMIPKQFAASVFESYEYLEKSCVGLPGETELLVSDVVEIVAEARFFICDGQIAASGIYEGCCDLEEGAKFICGLLREMTLPRTVVVDIAFLSDGRWCVVEFNATWGAGLNGCDAAGFELE